MKFFKEMKDEIKIRIETKYLKCYCDIVALYRIYKTVYWLFQYDPEVRRYLADYFVIKGFFLFVAIVINY